MQEKKAYNFNARYSTLLTGITLPLVQSVADMNADVALKKDSANDFRACIAINVVSLVGFTPGFSAPDPCVTDADRDELTDDGFAVTIVSDLGDGHNIAGWSKPSIWFPSNNGPIAVDWFDRAFNTVVHELGHTRTLGHCDLFPWYHPIQHIMFSGVPFVAGVGRECTLSEAKEYDQ